MGSVTMIRGIDLYEYEIIIDGKVIDKAYGNYWQALELEDKWQKSLTQDSRVKDNLEINFEDLLEDDSYWLNGNIKPLRLPQEDPPSLEVGEVWEEEIIPFKGEPVHSGSEWDLGLEPRN